MEHGEQGLQVICDTSSGMFWVTKHNVPSSPVFLAFNVGSQFHQRLPGKPPHTINRPSVPKEKNNKKSTNNMFFIAFNTDVVVNKLIIGFILVLCLSQIVLIMRH